MRHPSEYDLAMYATGDLSWWSRPLIRFHLSRCEHCNTQAGEYQQDQARTRDHTGVLPVGIDWERLATEMAANIRVGFAAGECVAPQVKSNGTRMGWRVAGATAAFAALLVGAWWLNMPASQSASLGRAMKAIAAGRGFQGNRALQFDERGPLVEATAAGIEIRDNGVALGVSSRPGARPVSVSLSVQGTARAHYIDSDTGQVTITSVYAQ